MKGYVKGLAWFKSIHRRQALLTVALVLGMGLAVGCGSTKSAKKTNDDFFTSGSREADQRASQRMARDEQITGSGEGKGEKGVKKAVAAKEGDANNGQVSTNRAAQVEGKLSLFDRLGGEQGLAKIVDDFVPRALQDPRVNWQRYGVTHGGFSFRHWHSETWNSNDNSIAILKKHFVQFLSLATGGPAKYDGKDIKATHANMHIANAEFDAALGDLKASLDKLQIPNKEQKELLAIVESTRPQIVTKR